MIKLVYAGLLLCSVFGTSAQEMDSPPALTNSQHVIAALRDIQLPLLNFETVNREEPTCDYIPHPEGMTGRTIANATKVPGRLIMTLGKDTLYDSGLFEKDFSGMTLRIRGNTSAYTDKKPYKIKLQQKHDLLMRGNETMLNDKDWVLLKCNDHLFTYIGFAVSKLLGMAWTPGYTFVNVSVNGDYRGLYYLTESVKRNPKCRIDVEKNSGLIIERDAYWWNDSIYFKTPNQHYYTFKYPDAEELTVERVAQVQEAIVALERSISRATYSEQIDNLSFARWLLAHDLLGTSDNGGSNIYLTRYDDSDSARWHMPMIWDFDTSFRQTDQWSRIHHGGFYFGPLLNSPCHDFRDTFYAEWNNIQATFFNDINGLLDSLATSDLGKAIDLSRQWDDNRWNLTSGQVADDVKTAKEWFQSRQQWMNEAMTVYDGIKELPAIKTSRNSASEETIFDLAGRRMATPPARGVFIQNGRKYVR